MRRFFVISILGFLVLGVSGLSLGGDSYEGRYEPDPYGRGGRIYLNHEGDPFGDTLDLMMKMDYLFRESERLKIERAKLRLLRERNEIEKARLLREDERVRKTKSHPRSNKYQSPSRNSGSPTHSNYYSDREPNQIVPFNVYFRSGKKLVCDKAWKKGDTIYLLAHGKKIAVSYEESEIDMGKSFVMNQ